MATKKAEAKKPTNGKTTTNRIKDKTTTKKLKPINRQLVTVRLIGTSPMIHHKWSHKAFEQIRAKQIEGRKTKDRELKDPKANGEAAMYRTKDGKPGAPAIGIKKACISAAHKDLGIEKVLVRKSLFVRPLGRNPVVPLETPNGKGDVKYEIEEDPVRVGQGSADLRYRPYFYEWAIKMQFEIDADLLQVDDLLLLLDRAGFGVGICEYRPEKSGEYGRFKIDPNFKVTVQQL